jgi:hypothetical protein
MLFSAMKKFVLAPEATLGAPEHFFACLGEDGPTALRDEIESYSDDRASRVRQFEHLRHRLGLARGLGLQRVQRRCGQHERSLEPALGWRVVFGRRVVFGWRVIRKRLRDRGRRWRTGHAAEHDFRAYFGPAADARGVLEHDR